MHGLIFDIKRFAVHDGPGIRATVFLKGCPLHCLWCHNPESMEATACSMPKVFNAGNSTFTEMEVIGRQLSVEELMHELRKEIIFMEESGGGVTFSGGEPLFQPAFLIEMLKACNAGQLHTAVDTSGFAPQQVIDEVALHANLFLFDLKLMDEDAHIQWTGLSNRIIFTNFERLMQKGAKVRVRVPLIPDVTLTNANLDALFEYLQPYRSQLEGIDLLPFHNTAAHKYERMGIQNTFKGIQSLPQEMLNSLMIKYNLK